MEFINASSVTKSDPGAEAEFEVRDSLRKMFDSDETGVLYHQYPIIERGAHRFDRKPDFVLLHQKYGLAIIECKGYTINQIETIESDTWKLQGTTQATATPLEQARDQGYRLRTFLLEERELRDGNQCVVQMRPIVALPNINRNEWNERGFDGPSEPRIITGDELGAVTLRSQIESLLPNVSLSDNEYSIARGVLSCGKAISGPPGNPTDDPQTRAEYYEQITKSINELDKKQQQIGLQTPPGPQQIRGIAGSGKTVLIAMKAARMISEPENWCDKKPENVSIALTFSTKSLYQVLGNLVRRFYRQFTDGSIDDAVADLDIIHGWGGHNTGDGVYYRLSTEMPEAQFRNFSSAKREYPNADDKQEPVANELLQLGDIPQIWDAILIDEAQDFGRKFLNMCREATTEQNRLIWAYDEAQDLTSLTAPSPKNIFGTDKNGNPVLDLSGKYRGGPQKTFIMRKSYRTSRSLLTLAHVTGMGLKRSDGPVQAITRQDGWENIGYEVDGDFRKIGSQATLRRPVDNSPHPIQGQLQPSELISHKSFESKSDEIDWVSKKIYEDVEQENLNPEQILVIPLCQKPRAGKQNKESVKEELRLNLSEFDIEINAVWEKNNKKFAQDNQVTISGINRAKGNEAASVYVLGVNAITDETWRDNEIKRRNQLFVALTRSRAWIAISGTNPGSSIHTEITRTINEIQSSEPQISFEIPNSQELDNKLETDTEGLQNATLGDFG